MSRWSLRTRLLALSGAATLISLALAGWVMTGVLGRVVTMGIDRRLDAQLAVLASAVGDDGRVDRPRLERRLGLLDAGPDWRWRIAGPAGRIDSADTPIRDDDDLPGMEPRPPLQPPAAPAARPVPIDGAGVHARRAVIVTDAGAVELTAAAPVAVIEQPIRAALAPLLGIVAALAALLAAAAVLQLRLGLRPILALRDQIAAIRSGARAAVDENQPAELAPLAAELNALAAENARALAGARRAAADLAHALKTPVATLALQLDDRPAAAAQLARIDGVIRHHLSSARTVAVGRRATTPVAPLVDEVVAAIRALHPRTMIAVDVPAGLVVAIDAHDLTEIVGNLLDNAARHARARASIRVDLEAGSSARVVVDDDGPGIPVGERDAAMRAGVRLDEAIGGHGFGLAIVRDLLALAGGTLALGENAAGGLRAVASVPLAPGR